MKHKLVFDTMDAQSIQASDSVGARVRSGSSGALITNIAKQRTVAATFAFVDGDVTTGTDTIAETAHGLQTGDKVQLSNAGGALPTGLATATDYFVIRVDADSFKLAASLEDAELGQAVDITAAAGGGTHTLTGQESEVRALDVNFTNASLEVTATDLDIRDLAFGTDSVDVSGSEVSLDAATLAALETITVVATDLDIRDLAFATDSVDVSGSEVSLDATTLAALENITVSATDLDIRDLDAAQDSVQSNLFDGSGNAISSTSGALDVNIASSDISINVDLQNGAEFAEDSAHTTGDIGNHILAVRQDTLAASTSADGDYMSLKGNSKGEIYVKDTDVAAALSSGITVNDAALANTAILASAQSVTTTSAALVSAGALTGRKYLSVYNNGNKDIYIGQSGVTTTNGFPVFPGSILDLRVGAAVAVHSVSIAGTQNTRVLELS